MKKQTEEVLMSESTPMVKIEISGAEFSRYTSHQIGVILTILEASMPEGKQLEAVKSLVRNSIYRDAQKLELWSYRQIEGEGETFPFWPEK